MKYSKLSIILSVRLRKWSYADIEEQCFKEDVYTYRFIT